MVPKVLEPFKFYCYWLNAELSEKQKFIKLMLENLESIFSSPGRSPGRAIVLPPASALASSSALALASALAAASALAKC